MPKQKSAHKLYAHITWCVDKRLTLINLEIEKQLKSIIKEICDEMSYQIIALETVPDHVHLLIRFHPDHQLLKLIKTLKGRSSRLITRKTGKQFQWQRGYGVNTVGVKALETAQKYVSGQKKHHAFESE